MDNSPTVIEQLKFSFSLLVWGLLAFIIVFASSETRKWFAEKSADFLMGKDDPQ